MSSVCHKCGRVNGERYKFCLGCGAPVAAPATPEPTPGTLKPIPEPEPPAPAQSAPLSMAETLVSGETEAPQAQPGMKLCVTCGADVPLDFAFCGRCGTRFDMSPPPAQAEPVPNIPDPRTEETSLDRSTAETEAVSESEVLGALEDSVPESRNVSSPVRGKLVLIHPDGSRGGTLVLVEGDNILGRRATPTVLGEAEYVSPEHVRVRCESGMVLVDDLDSLNGTFLRVTGAPIELQHGDVLRIGQQLLRFELVSRKKPRVQSDDATEVLGSSPGDMWGTLHRIIGPHQLESTVYPLEGEQTDVGRESGHVTFRNDGFVSGRHARIFRQGAQAMLEDLGSSNGTYIRLRNIYKAKPGDLLLLGQQLFQLEMR